MKSSCTMATPIGRVRIDVEDGAVIAIHLLGNGRRSRNAVAPEAPPDPVLAEACRQLAEYFAGARATFDLPLRPRGTAFQQEVWRALCAIPPGETRSYAEIARAIGRPGAVRAVGAANGQNPIAIVVPCHRVIGSDGTLVGYAGGLDTKRWLLRHEREREPGPLFTRAEARPSPGRR
ncbi:MAG TPA: methylated-DNA--[protein]-cysteine S-methyltransferase [Anaeromyxobacteraceae bacterium]|nr:methylated-DNA--[protein]-cysteine S-methyltransferase [Anaeromyxobacteraceae bacterium]